MLNTLVVTFAATIMALVFGFLTAWIFTTGRLLFGPGFFHGRSRGRPIHMW